MIAAVAALGLGAYSCQNGPGDDPGKKPGSEGDTGMRLTLRMPAADGQTRAESDDYNPIDATPEENVVNDVHVWVFDADGDAVEFNSYTAVPISNFTPPAVGGNVWTMKNPIPTTAGDVRIWVGLNLTGTETGDEAELGEFATEAAMLSAVRTVVNISDKLDEDEGIAMFSNAKPYTLLPIPVGETFEEQEPPFNVVPIDVFRAVSKVAATETGADADYILDWAEAGNPNGIARTDDSELALTYTPLHAWIIQHAKETWMAPRYPVATYNAVGGTGEVPVTRPITYYYWETLGSYPATSSNISQWDEDTAWGKQIAIGEYEDLESLNDEVSKYIGENSRVGAVNSLNKNTTYAFISTGVLASQLAIWENGDFAWKDVNDVVAFPTTAYPNIGNGFGYDEADETKGEDIKLIKWDGYDYITDELHLPAIVRGLAGRMNIAIVPELDEDLNPDLDDDTDNEDPNLDNDDDEDTAWDDPSTAATEMTQDQFYADESVKARLNIYTYMRGYVHFQYWINKIANNQYEVLRNQFLHLQVSGMNQDKNGTFPGYPGNPDDPRIPINPNDDDPENPDPLEPEDPVDPEATEVLVNVTVHPWTYRWNEIKLGR